VGNYPALLHGLLRSPTPTAGRCAAPPCARYCVHMSKSEPTIGVRALRARLSAYVREAARGKTVTISDRRRQPIARLVPVARSADDEVLDRLAARGVLQRGIGKPVPKPIRPRKTRRKLSDLVIEDRG